MASLLTMAAMGITHVPIPPYHPRATEKVERFNRTMLEEWAYVRPYISNSARRRLLPGWLAFCNRRLPDIALGGGAAGVRMSRPLLKSAGDPGLLTLLPHRTPSL
jgi:hypothetical protein